MDFEATLGQLEQREIEMNIKAKNYGQQSHIKSQREENRSAIEAMAKQACSRMDGYAQISPRFAIVDINKYTVKEKS